MKVGITFSTFDLFHAGHVLMLKEAKENCDHLIVGLQSDPTINRPEKNAPVQSMYERFVQVRACLFVDQIIPYSHEQDIFDILASCPIDIRFIGEEYRDRDFTAKIFGEANGIATYYNRRQHSYSSTNLRKRVSNAKQD